MARVFFTDQASFTFSSVPEVQVDSSILAYVYLNGSGTPHTVLALAPGQITENEYSPGLFVYDISDYEVPSTTTSISVTWVAYVGAVQTDTFPVVTTPTPVLQLASDYLEVTASTPTDGATGVDVHDLIILTFDEAIDPDTVVQGQMFLQRAGTTNIGKVTAALNPNDATQLIISPLTKLDDNATYEVHVPIGTIAGTSGAGLEYDYKLTFKTTIDDIQSLYQATDEGVVERAGPLKIVVPTAPSTSTLVMTSSTPADLSCNQTTQEIQFVFDEDVDPYNSIPELTFTFAPVFDTYHYQINKSFWGYDDTEPTHPTATIDGGGVAARGGIVFAAQPNDAETITISDGTTSVIFEFDDNATFTDTQVVIGATLADTITNLVAAITASALDITAVDNALLLASSVLLINNTTGVAGNVTITTTSAATVSGMSGGVDATETAPFTTVEIVDNVVTVTLNKVPTGNAYFTIQLNGLVSAADPTMAFNEAEITYITGLWPLRLSVGEIRRRIRSYISDDLTDCDIAVLLTSMGISYYEVYGDAALAQQNCSIQASTILVLLEDYMADAGLDGMKQLGPFSVSQKSAWFMQGPYKNWQDALEECEETLNANFNVPTVGIKSSNNPLERPTDEWRLRTWNRPSSMDPYLDENKGINRAGKIPPLWVDWS